LIYAASSKSNHILVNGTILLGNDLYLVDGFSRTYSVMLTDAYRNPISNAVIEFTYNGVSESAITNNQGIATITVSGLSEGNYPIVYSYVDGDNVCQANIHVSNSVLNSKNTISDLSPYLSNSRNCQASNAEIVALARQLTEGLTTPLDKAIAIFEYVKYQISYSYYYDTYYGALGTLHAKTGNCVDQTHLSIALYRAAGFPARYVHGTCIFGDGDISGHVWAQVLVDGTWIVSDSINTRNSLGEVVNWNNYNYGLKGYYSAIYF
jgi:transglutaminase-like putative cysteine protease